MEKTNIPNHIAIIMDGNRRWARERKIDYRLGHKEGAKTLEKIVRYSKKVGIKYITVYAFSTENWKRSEEEVGALMLLLKTYLDDYSKRADSENIKVKVLGDISALSEGLQKSIKKCEERTKDNDGILFCIGINYGGRDEIIRSVKKIIEKQFDSDSLTEKSISDNFDIPELPDVDFLIRTGGEKRLSNFLLWHSAYAELCFTDTLWPDYTEDELIENLNEFYKRTRRFGDVLIK